MILDRDLLDRDPPDGDLLDGNLLDRALDMPPVRGTQGFSACL